MKRSLVVLGVVMSARLAWGASEAYYNYLQGMTEERAGNTAKALEAYEKAVQQDPHAVQVYRDIAELRLRSAQPDEALKAAEKVRELAPTDPMSYIFLGNVHVAKGDLAKAADAYAQALKIEPTNLRALENLGNYYALTDPEKALHYYERYLTISPRDPDINFQIAIVHHRRSQFAKALAYYRKSIDSEPNQLASHLAIADLYEQQKSTAQAISAYRRAAELQPENPLVSSRLGALYYKNRQWEDAWTAFKSAESSAPNDPAIHYSLARVAEEKKDWKSAATHAEKAWELSQDPQFLPLAAYFLTLDRRPEAAIKYLEKARTYDPANSNVLLFLGMNYMDLGKFDLAREALSHGVANHPNDIQLRFHLGTAEDRLGQFDAAVEQFQNVLRLEPRHSAAMNYLGYSWAERGMRLEEAEKLLRKALELEPENGAYLDSMGWVLYKKNDPCGARSYLERAVYYTQDALIFEHLGDAYNACGQTGAALQSWSRALAAAPKNEALQKRLTDVGSAFFSSPDAPKYVHYLEGGFKQASRLESRMKFKGRMGKRRLETAGVFSYERPDMASFVIAPTDKMAGLQYLVSKDGERVLPAETNPFLDQMALDGLTALAKLLSGNLTQELQPKVLPKVGVVTRFSRPNESGGKDEIEISAYDYVEGIWLPKEMRVQNATTGWSAEVSFSDWVIADRHKTKPAK